MKTKTTQHDRRQVAKHASHSMNNDGLRMAAVLTAMGATAAPTAIPATAFCRAHSVRSELEYKLRCRANRQISYHMHLGLNTWPATRDALHEIAAALAESEHHIDRFGLCLDRGMSVPSSHRDFVPKETGPRLSSEEWAEIGEIEPIQPHLGDFMIGTPASLENTVHALQAGVTTIGNLGQYFAFNTPGGSDDIKTTEATVMALGSMAALRAHGALVHSYLDDGPAMQLSHYGSYVGWAALELYIVEELLGARLAHCFGGLVPQPVMRAILSFALDDLHGRDSVGSMIYGNTVDYNNDRVHNQAVLATYLLVDIATQLRRPTGHAITPIPLSEAQRIPSPAEIIEVHCIAHEIEAEARRSGDLFNWEKLERLGSELADYGERFAKRALALLANNGVDVDDAAQVLLAIRRVGPMELERRVALPAPPEIAHLALWKAEQVRHYTDAIEQAVPSLSGMRIVLAVLEVHDVIRDALVTALPRRGCEVIPLPSDTTPSQIAQVALEEDADAVVIGTYNGGALSIAHELCATLQREHFDGAVFFGGRLNEDVGGPLPIDVRSQLEQLGICCVERVEDLGSLLASLRCHSMLEIQHSTLGDRV